MNLELLPLVWIPILIYATIYAVVYWRKRSKSSALSLDPQFPPLSMVEFLNNMELEKPVRFTSKDLKEATHNFKTLLGSGGFGSVFKGIVNHSGTPIAVKVLNKKIQEQFMAERTHHFNLVRLYGFCFDKDLQALVYEYMENGSLGKYLFSDNDTNILGLEALHKIDTGTAKGIAYLHEECPQCIIHYDIKPGEFSPNDFGLAKLLNRDRTHVTMTGGRGTPGYAAPELWMPLPVTRKCDVYSFGMLLFEIIGRRKNFDIRLPESEEWFPIWVWGEIEKGEKREIMRVCKIEENDEELVYRMVKVALWCIQYNPESRPLMSIVVKMLEGGIEIPTPLNPFPVLNANAWNFSDSDSASASSRGVMSASFTGTVITKKRERLMDSGL